MDSVSVLRQLWHSRRMVALVAPIAVLGAVLLTCQLSFPPRSKSYTVGTATARILVDTPQSQVVEVEPKGSDTLGSRASVLANLMVSGELQASIARRAGLAPKQLIATSHAAPEMDAPPQLNRNSHVLTTGVLMNSDLAQLPIITVETQAPDVRQATRLANASVAALRAYLDTKASTEDVAERRRLQVSSLGPPLGEPARRGHGLALGLAVAVLLFVLGCATILVLSALRRSWEAAMAVEGAEHEQAFADEGLDELTPFLDDDAVMDVDPRRTPDGARI